MTSHMPIVYLHGEHMFLFLFTVLGCSFTPLEITPKTANRFEISSLLENILLKQVRWCLTLVGLYLYVSTNSDSNFRMFHPYIKKSCPLGVYVKYAFLYV
jgi:hypothetical protein